jgi:hypothetical protein
MRTRFGRLLKGAILAALLLAAVAVAGCTTTPHDGNGNRPPQGCAAVERQPPAETGSGALIVTDVSGSMKGFVAARSTRLYTVHDALERAARGALGSVGSDATIRRCDLGLTLECGSPHAKGDMDKPIYTAQQSRLDLFLAPGQPGSPPDAVTLDPYRLAVLVTDGLQAQSGDSGGKPCLGGADPECIAYMLEQRAAAGYGVWLALLLLPFDGTHDAERPLDGTHWQRIEQHVAGLRQDPFFKGVDFRVQRPKGDANFRTYQYRGVKPFLVVALSKDWRAGRDFIRQFTDIARREGVTQPAGGSYWIELAPIPSHTLQITGLRQSAADANANIRVVDRRRKEGFYDFLVECEREGETTFVLEAKRGDAEQAASSPLPIEFSFVPSGEAALPAQTLAFKSPLTPAADAGTYQVEVSCNCKQVRPGERQQWLRLQADIKADPGASSPWGALHSDNTYEAPERLYGLKEIVQRILGASAKEPRTTDCLRIRIDRK